MEMENVKIIEKVEIVSLAFPVQGYAYDALIYRSVDNGRTFWHCGHGKFFKSLPDAEKFKAAIEAAQVQEADHGHY